MIKTLKIWQNLQSERIFYKITNLSQFSWSDLLSNLPEIYLLLMILVALFVVGTANFIPASNNVEKKRITLSLYTFTVNTMWITIFICIYQLSFFVKISLINFTTYSLTDLYTLVVQIVILFTTILILYASKDSLSKHPRHLIEYPVLLLLTTLFLLILVSAYNFFTIFLAIIGFSLNLYVLLLNDSFNQASREAGIKYFYLSTVSTGLLIGGIFLLYLVFNSTSFLTISWLLYNWKNFANLDSSQFLITVMLYFIIFGFFFKLAAFPCHLWAPEVYDGSPNTMTAMFVLPIKVATFAIFLRILGYTFGDLYQSWHYILWMSSFFSMLWGCLGALTEDNLKRFLAYSSINQMGFLLMGLTSATFEGFRSSLIYLFLYILMNVGFFLLFLTTREVVLNKSLTYLTDLNDFAQRNNLYSLGFVIILFSMAGIPPLGGFFGKYFIFLHSFETGHLFLVVIGMFTSVIAAYYYLRLIKIMWFEQPILNRFHFQTHMTNNLVEIFILIEFILIAFIILIPWFFSYFNLITEISIYPIALKKC